MRTRRMTYEHCRQKRRSKELERDSESISCSDYLNFTAGILEERKERHSRSDERCDHGGDQGVFALLECFKKLLACVAICQPQVFRCRMMRGHHLSGHVDASAESGAHLGRFDLYHCWSHPLPPSILLFFNLFHSTPANEKVCGLRRDGRKTSGV